MELPDAVLAFKLLDTACVEVKDRELALTTCTDLTFALMKSALKRIFGGKTSTLTMGMNQDIAYVLNRGAKGADRRGQKVNSQKHPCQALTLWISLDADQNVPFAKVHSTGLRTAHTRVSK